LFLNCIFKEATGYSLTYANTNAILYINCTFTGTRWGNYSGTHIEVRHSSSWARFNQNHLLFLNCVFKEATGYSLTYANTNAVLYINCVFTGTRWSNYSGTNIEVRHSSYSLYFLF
jgi:hypothetical protein